ncbi:hypothetical protein Rs2_15788 [Raphanus sativus]|nr:hypothetical protein Rs2_15788 [Raphanus sativus]
MQQRQPVALPEQKKSGKGKRHVKGGNRFWKNIGLGFQTPLVWFGLLAKKRKFHGRFYPTRVSMQSHSQRKFASLKAIASGTRLWFHLACTVHIRDALHLVIEEFQVFSPLVQTREFSMLRLVKWLFQGYLG